MVPEIPIHWCKIPGKSKQKYVPTTYVNLGLFEANKAFKIVL